METDQWSSRQGLTLLANCPDVLCSVGKVHLLVGLLICSSSSLGDVQVGVDFSSLVLDLFRELVEEV